MAAGGENNAMHVLFVTYHLPKGQEPGAFRPWMEARLLQMAGYRVTVLTSGVQYMTGEDIRTGKGWVSEERAGEIRILRTWAPAHHRRSLLRRMLNYLSFVALAFAAALVKVGPVDRVFAGTNPIFMVPMVYLASRLKRAGLVLDERDLYPETAVALGIIKDGWLARRLLGMQQFFRRRANALLAATPGIRNALLSYGLPPDKVGLLYNGDAFIAEDVTDDAPRPDLGAELQGRFLVGYTGGLGRVNDVVTLLRAAGRLREEPRIAVVVLGAGERREEYEQYCRHHDLGNVYFLGAVPRSEARRFIREMDVCVHLYPAIAHFEGAMGSKTFDYLGLGKPVVFAGGGDIVELLRVSGGGIAVPAEDDRALGDAILRLLQDESLRRGLGEAGRRWFAENITAASACSVVRRAIERGPAARAPQPAAP